MRVLACAAVDGTTLAILLRARAFALILASIAGSVRLALSVGKRARGSDFKLIHFTGGNGRAYRVVSDGASGFDEIDRKVALGASLALGVGCTAGGRFKGDALQARVAHLAHARGRRGACLGLKLSRRAVIAALALGVAIQCARGNLKVSSS